MSANPADIGKFTNDGVVIASPTPDVGQAVATLHPDARINQDEFNTFFDNVADAQTMLDEKYSYLGEASPIHLGITIRDVLGLGSTIPIGPTVPTFMVIDDQTGISQLARCRGYAHDFETDSFAVEVMS